MVKVNKKVMTFCCALLAVLVAGSTITANLITNGEQKNDVIRKNILNRDNNYHHYSLTNVLQNNFKLNDLVQTIAQDNFYTYVISEEKFVNNFKEMVRSTLKSLSTFSSNYLSYVIECNYKIVEPLKINVDLV
ncbi:hypothetical protein IJQ19_03160 [bacterium]|nr:hypothetical protein [bacterium]